MRRSASILVLLVLATLMDDTHSIFVSDSVGLPWDTGMTWDPRVFDVVRGAIDGADGALATATRIGC